MNETPILSTEHILELARYIADDMLFPVATSRSPRSISPVRPAGLR